MRVVILAPRRADGGWRDRLWVFCRDIWEREYPDWPIYEGHHLAEEGPFNRSAAINRAATAAGDWDVALVIDSDTVSEPGAVRSAVEHAWQTGVLSIAHDQRYMLTDRATNQILGGLPRDGWGRRHLVKTVYADSVSCAVAVSRPTWELVGGFDERFVGWGFEDTGFHIAVETLTGRAKHVEHARCYHLWHPPSPEASTTAPTFSRNHALKRRYEVSHWDPERVQAVLDGRPDPGGQFGVIPRVLHRTVPERTSDEVEGWWNELGVLHPTWDLRTWRDPLDPSDFPLAGYLHALCANGAQKAGLIRLELLVTHGGVYVDSDVKPVRPLDALTWTPAFAAWEDEKVVPDAVMGAVPGHPAFREMLRRAMALIEGGSRDAWATGPGVSTAILPWRDDVLLLPPGAFYPVHYREKQALGTRNQQPWVFLEHRWHHSWSDKPSRVQAPAPVSVTDRREDLNVAICMPWRDSGNKWRQDAHSWCRTWWEAAGFPVVEGDGESRSAMCNDAARKAEAAGYEVLVFADADTWAPHAQVAAAASVALESGKAVHAFTRYTRVTPNETRHRTTKPGDPKLARLIRSGATTASHVSGLTAISVAALARIGGFDERFTGWGFEDQAFHLAAETILGVDRVEGPAMHWYHPPDATKRLPPSPERIELIQEYCRAAGRVPAYGRTGKLALAGKIALGESEGSPDADRMQGVLSSPGGPLSRADVAY